MIHRKHIEKIEESDTKNWNLNLGVHIWINEFYTSMLHKNKYIVLPQFIKVPTEVLDDMTIQVKNKGNPIFGVDLKRHQCNLSYKNQNVKEFMRTLNGKVQNIYKGNPYYIRSNWVVLRSKPGSKRQQPHQDYEPSKKLSECPNDKYPLAIICALMDGTTLNVWDKDEKEKIQHLNKGDILIFRGDLIHAGSAYENENIRMHCYIDSTLIPRTPNRTHIISRLCVEGE